MGRGGATDSERVEARDAAKTPTWHNTALTTRNFPVQWSMVLRSRNPTVHSSRFSRDNRRTVYRKDLL